MAIITGVKFRTPGKVYYFAPGEAELKYNDHVIVETARGLEYGRVVLPVKDVPEEELKQPLKEVIRIATPEDAAHEKENREKEEEAYVICLKKIREHELEMKLVSAEYTFDNSKLTFYFTADGRVDFRELVKDLAGVFRTRIELRQIGVRDETKIIGGIGICGRPLCCHAYLHDFAPVSIKMAKEQNLSLNPTKISGSCGRLMCCLKNEAETYEYLNQGLPRKGDGATTPDGLPAEIQSVNILRQTARMIVTLDNDEKEMREYPVSEITFVPKKGRKKNPEEGPAVYHQKISNEEAQSGVEAFFADREDMELFPEDKEEEMELLALEMEEAESEESVEELFEEDGKKNRDGKNAKGQRSRDRKNRRRRPNRQETSENIKETAENVKETAEHAGPAPEQAENDAPQQEPKSKRRHKNHRRGGAARENGEASPRNPENAAAPRQDGGSSEGGKVRREENNEGNAPKRHRRKRSHSRKNSSNQQEKTQMRKEAPNGSADARENG